MEEIQKEQEEEEETMCEDDLDEWGTAGAVRYASGKGGADAAGSKDNVAKIVAAQAAKKNAASAASANAQQVTDDEASMKANPFKPTKTGMGRAMGLAEARKLINSLVQEVMSENSKAATENLIRKLIREAIAAKPKKKPATVPDKKPAPKKK